VRQAPIKAIPFAAIIALVCWQGAGAPAPPGIAIVDSAFCRTTREQRRSNLPQEARVKYLCLGYLDTEKWALLSESEQMAMMDKCFAYDDDVLRKNGYWVHGEGLQGPETASTLRCGNGKVSVTDGPFAETKEVLGGLLILEARDLDHAIQIMSNHPGATMGPWEIRPIQDLTEAIRASAQRRARK